MISWALTADSPIYLHGAFRAPQEREEEEITAVEILLGRPVYYEESTISLSLSLVCILQI